VAGVLWAEAWRVASPTQFGADVSVAALAVPVIGGLGSLAGAVAAAVLLYMPAFFIGPLVSGVFGNFGHQLGFQLFLAGMGLVATLQRFPTGVAGLAQQGWQAFLNRRADHVAAQQADADQDVPLTVNGVTVRFGGVVALNEVAI